MNNESFKDAEISAIIEALNRRAKGYSSCEVIEEYALCEGEMSMVKKRLTKKDVPADISAAKLLLERKTDDYSQLSDEQLLKEKKRLLKLLKENNKNQKEG